FCSLSLRHGKESILCFRRVQLLFENLVVKQCLFYPIVTLLMLSANIACSFSVFCFASSSGISPFSSHIMSAVVLYWPELPIIPAEWNCPIHKISYIKFHS
uniref:Uncharacterized protein n=1 Tax=Parascaris univalens TaxID=6257 RepID=A0A914ZNQ9_PARUN